MYKLHIVYSNGETKIYSFENWEEACWFIHNEGDHVVDYYFE